MLKSFFLLPFVAICFAMDFSSVSSFKASFVQYIEGEAGAVPMAYKGMIEAKVPSRVKWTYSVPVKKEIYLIDRNAIINEPTLNQVTIAKVNQNVDFISIIKNLNMVSKNTYESVIGETKYTLLTNDSVPYRLSYLDGFGNNVFILFSDVVVNGHLDDVVFDFTIPGGAEVISAN